MENLAEDISSSTLEIAGPYDVCYNAYKEERTANSETIIMSRGIYYGSYESDVIYPTYQNRSYETHQCYQNLCNNDKYTNPNPNEIRDVNLECYRCQINASDPLDSESCLHPDSSLTPYCTGDDIIACSTQIVTNFGNYYDSQNEDTKFGFRYTVYLMPCVA